jgi:hypothetical protein
MPIIDQLKSQLQDAITNSNNAKTQYNDANAKYISANNLVSSTNKSWQTAQSKYNTTLAPINNAINDAKTAHNNAVTNSQQVINNIKQQNAPTATSLANAVQTAQAANSKAKKTNARRLNQQLAAAIAKQTDNQQSLKNSISSAQQKQNVIINSAKQTLTDAQSKATTISAQLNSEIANAKIAYTKAVQDKILAKKRLDDANIEKNNALSTVTEITTQIKNAIQIQQQENAIAYSSSQSNRETIKENFSSYNNYIMPHIEGLGNIEDDAEQLLNDLVQFNALYFRYMHCNNSSISTTTNLAINNDCAAKGYRPSTQFKVPNAAGSAEKDYLLSALNILSQKIQSTDKNAIISDIPTLSNLPRGTPTANATAIQSKHQQILNMRQELDAKLKELYQTPDSIANMYKQQYDATIYSGILLSALAASLLFYLFKDI